MCSLFPYANLLRTLFNAGCLPRRSTCYCGNKLVMQAEKVAPYKCDEECYSDKTKTCGGTKFFSMYQLHGQYNEFLQLFNDHAKFATFLQVILSTTTIAMVQQLLHQFIKVMYYQKKNNFISVINNNLFSFSLLPNYLFYKLYLENQAINLGRHRYFENNAIVDACLLFCRNCRRIVSLQLWLVESSLLTF